MPSLKILVIFIVAIGLATVILLAMGLYWRIVANSGSLPDADEKPDAAYPPEERWAPPVAAFQVNDRNGKYGYINRFGFEVIKPQFDFAEDFIEDRAIVYLNHEQCVIDRTAFVTFAPEKRMRLRLSGLGRMVWFEESRGHWGLSDEHGRVAIKPVYGDVREFTEGIAAVNIGATFRTFIGAVGGKWGFIDGTGKIVVPIENERVGKFSEGLARLENTHETRYVDKSDNTIFQIDAKYSMSSDFSEGLAPAYEANANPNKPVTTHYYNRQGKIEFSIAGYGKEFHEGLAPYTEQGTEDKRDEDRLCRFIDHSGNIVIRPQFSKVGKFNGGLAPVRLATADPEEKSKWAYIDQTGQLRIKAEFNEALPFRGGIARAHIGGHRAHITDAPPTWAAGAWYLIDPAGRKLKKELDQY
jgi:WG repeat protein